MNVLRTVLVAGFFVGFSSAGQPEPQPAESATIEVRLPAAAVLTVDTYVTQQRGSVRTFVTPPLAPGKTYQYELVAVWNDGGAKKEVRHALVRAGGRTLVDFNAPEPVAKAKVDTKPGKANAPKSRTFLFTYETTVTDLPPGKEAKIWLPYPSSSPEQTVSLVSKNVPVQDKIGKDKEYGNQYLYVKAMANAEGKIPLSMTFKVTRKEVLTKDGKSAFKPSDQEKIARFLEADKLVPIGGKGLMLIQDQKVPSDQLSAARLFYEKVNDHMKYDKSGKGWGRGDSDWACDSKTGNCTDFHSLFISLARAQKIPAKFEIGFSIPTDALKGKIGGYHCWAWFLPDGEGWVPVDISEANRHPNMRGYYFGNLTEDRVTFCSGRDLTLVPAQKGPPLNFLVYPYVEVDGEPYATDKVQRSFSYEESK
jgi:uncharacterized protein (TIGR03000 family)